MKKDKNAKAARDALKKMEKKSHGIISEFKEFALRGSVFDMAVGVVIGAAFNDIIKAFVANLIMPLVGLVTVGVKFEDLSVTIRGEQFAYGAFIQQVVSFFCIAVALFFAIKLINLFRNPFWKKTGEEEEPTTPTLTDTELLTEIRDLLKEQAKK
jgi:large conductance mechanosensitive channel